MPLNLSLLYEEASRRSMTQVFGGINKNLRSNDGEFYDMMNLTSDYAPVLAVRERRYKGFRMYAENPVALASYVEEARETGFEDGICWIDEYSDGTSVLAYGNIRVDLDQYGYTPTAQGRKEKHIVKLGAYLIIIPDMIYVNTVDEEEKDCGRIEDKIEDNENVFILYICDNKGEQAIHDGGYTPGNPQNGDTWYNTKEKTLNRFSEETGEWYQIECYVKIRCEKNQQEFEPVPFSMKKQLKEGDSIYIEGLHSEVDGVKKVIRVEKNYDSENSVWSFLVPGTLPAVDYKRTATSENPVLIKRVIPKLDHVCEAGNRLWGCRYGDDGNGNFVNEIYCSARGDFFRWIAGEATDEDAPVTFSIGTDGNWTGCINYGGYPTFFKEHTMYRVGGYGASGFALQETPCSGVQTGAHRSLAVVNNVLYYKSAAGIMGFDGSVPVNVSDKLGRIAKYNNAVGGACGGKYYVSMWISNTSRPAYETVLYVLDTERGLWHKEDETECLDMVAGNDNLYFISVTRKNDTVKHAIEAVRPPDLRAVGDLAMETKMIPWYAETGIIGLESPDAKYVSRLAIRMHLDAGATVRVLVQYDSSGYWKQIAGTEAATMRTVTMPVVPARCDHMRLRLEGVGGCKVYSITKTVENGEEA